MPMMDTEDDSLVPFSGPSICASTSSSFLSIGTSPLALGGHRRQSLASSETSTPPDFFSASSGSTASPSTPISNCYASMGSNGQSMMFLPSDFESQDVYNRPKDDGIWMPADSGCHNKGSFLDSSMEAVDTNQFFHKTYDSREWNFLSSSVSNPSFSRAIFDDHQQSSDFFSSDGIVQWTPTVLQTPPQTVTPSATFRPILTSSPSYKVEPMTPLRYSATTTSILSSSPCTLYSPTQLLSQQNLDSVEQVMDGMSLAPRHIARARRLGPRSARLPCDRRSAIASSRSSRSAVSKSGVNCDVVIEGNRYPCEYVDCVDKSGKRKMFKRREHAKRHTDTVHRKSRRYDCWVPRCTTGSFTRSDNLTTHLKSTHGKRSAGARNRYVSTLDPNSEYYDPEWKGDLDDDGNPIDEHGRSLRPRRCRQ